MTERTAWLTIARAYETPYRERTAWVSHLALNGVCWAFDVLARDPGPSADRYDYSGRSILGRTATETMHSTVLDSLNWGDGGDYQGNYFCPFDGITNDALRADYCRFQYYRLGGESID